VRDHFPIRVVLCQYVHFLYRKNGAHTQAASALYAVLAFAPQYNGHLPRSAHAVKQWSKATPVRHHPPVSWTMLLLIADQLRLDGRGHMALAALVGFQAMLRIGELSNLLVCDVTDLRAGFLGPPRTGAALHLAQTKTGPQQWAYVFDPAVSGLLLDYIRGRRPNEFVFGFRSAQFQYCFTRAAAAAGVPGRYTAHALRGGGATALHLSGSSIKDIMHLGRWSSLKTATSYVQAGAASLAEAQLPHPLLEFGRLLSCLVSSRFALSQTT
jgi:integrase